MGHAETFDHTADLGLKVCGSDLNDLFRTAAEGLFDCIVVNRDAVRPTLAETVELQAEDEADLFLAWLQEVLFRSEIRHVLYASFDVEVAEDGRSLRAEIRGEEIDRDRHELDHEVKAITHHGFAVTRTAEGWVAEVILDI